MTVPEPMSPLWSAPFACVLLSVALGPAVFGGRWHRAMPAAMALCVASLMGPVAWVFGPGAAGVMAWHAAVAEYLPFVALLVALYAAAGGVLIQGGFRGTPLGNTAWLATGTALAGVIGTTGAAMVLIHPFLRANAHRARRTHLVVFFIVLVGNAGGATSPLGDPPLFVGFLRGVPFWWPLRTLGPMLLVLAGVLLAGFFAWESWAARGGPAAPAAVRPRVRGWGNIAILAAAVGLTVATAAVDWGEVSLWGERVSVVRAAAVAGWFALAGLAAGVTARGVRARNMFTWGPMREVAILFAAVFATIGPVFSLLHARAGDAFGTPTAGTLFWIIGGLSAVLDNAPTYLVFFELPGGRAALPGIAAGAVFFGALTYIGNAPNLMVRGIAARRGVRMPGFFGYFATAAGLLLPVFGLLTVLFFR